MSFKTPIELVEAAIADSQNKLRTGHIKRLILGFISGVQISMAAIGASIMSFDAPTVGIQKLIFGCIFTCGLLMIVFTGSELFTGNTAMMAGVLDKKVSVWEYIRTMAITYVANLAGGIFAAWTVSLTNLWGTAGGKYGAYVMQVALNKETLGFVPALVLAVYCNMLVCTAIWISRASSDGAGKIWSMFFPIMLFAGIGFEHSIANAYIIPAGLFAKGNAAAVAAFEGSLESLTWKGFFIDNLVPVTIGNWLGGAVLVAAFFYIAYKRFGAEKQ